MRSLAEVPEFPQSAEVKHLEQQMRVVVLTFVVFKAESDRLSMRSQICTSALSLRAFGHRDRRALEIRALGVDEKRFQARAEDRVRTLPLRHLSDDTSRGAVSAVNALNCGRSWTPNANFGWRNLACPAPVGSTSETLHAGEVALIN